MNALRLGLQALRSNSLLSSTSASSTRPLLDDATVRSPDQAHRDTHDTTTIYLRIEAPDCTIFEGIIATAGHDVTLPNGETHHADGKNNRREKTSYPTPTAALDDAAHLEGFTFDGKYSPKYDDIFITRIADTEQDDSRFWGILLNYHYTKVGGCHQRLEEGDNVLFAFNAFKKKYFLKLSGPTNTTVGVPIIVTVVDGTTNVPMSDVSIEGSKSDRNGRATLVLRSPGVHILKAEREKDCIRSNALRVTVTR